MLRCNMSMENDRRESAVYLRLVIDTGLGLANPVRVCLHDVFS